MVTAEQKQTDTDRKPLAILVHGLHKTGTMFLYQLFFRLCRERGIRFFSANHPEPNDHLVTPEFDTDFCLGPIRTFDTNGIELSPRHRVRRIFQVRDPRDILVSQFHSFGWRHSDQGFNEHQSRWRNRIRDMSIDEYVVNPRYAIQPLLRRYQHLVSCPPGASDALIRYEQMVTDFPGWLSRIIPLLEFSRPHWIQLKYSLKYRREFRPENHPAAHKRQVAPGDFRRSLQPPTIGKLNELLETVLIALDYPLE